MCLEPLESICRYGQWTKILSLTLQSCSKFPFQENLITVKYNLFPLLDLLASNTEKLFAVIQKLYKLLIKL